MHTLSRFVPIYTSYTPRCIRTKNDKEICRRRATVLGTPVRFMDPFPSGENVFERSLNFKLERIPLGTGQTTVSFL